MTQSERVSELFRRIRDWHVDKLGMHITDAASDLQEFMRQCCREYNNETYEWEDISDTKTLTLLRQKFREDKKWLKSQKIRNMSKHKNGYWPKIEYWTTQIRDEVFNTKKPELDEVMYFHKKLQYFLGKQMDLENQHIFDSQQEFTAVK